MTTVSGMEVISITSGSDKNPAEPTTCDSGSVGLNNQGSTKASPKNTMENSQTEKPAKGKKGKKVSAVFQRVWKAIKRPFLCCDPDGVIHLGPHPDVDDSDWSSDSSSSRNTPTTDTDPDPELVCLPGQICEDLESHHFPGPFRVEQTSDSDSTSPESPSISDPANIDLAEEKPIKGKKKKAVCACFRKICKSVKQLFTCYKPNREQDLTPQPEPDDTEAMPVQDPSESTDSVEPESEYQSDQESTDDVLSSTDHQSDSSVSIELPYGSVVSRFQVGELLGSGSFGVVYEGSHIFNDSIKVAIKCVLKRKTDLHLDIDGHSKPVPAEVALLLRLRQPPLCPNIIQLHQWHETEQSFILIMEYPKPCKTLARYMMASDFMSEEKARRLMRQLFQAVKFCAERGVFHGDMHAGNILLTEHSLKLTLIDFGCARPVTSEPFNSIEYRGAKLYTPPEVIRRPVYHSNPANVWALGVVLFQIVHGYLPFRDQDEILRGYLNMKPTLTSACRDLIFQSLIRNPVHRLTLDQVEDHRWLNPLIPDSKQQSDKRLDSQVFKKE